MLVMVGWRTLEYIWLWLSSMHEVSSVLSGLVGETFANFITCGSSRALPWTLVAVGVSSHEWIFAIRFVRSLERVVEQMARRH